ncbi:MAG: Uma2 family endonuclease [Egibacteraceae bacterium]
MRAILLDVPETLLAERRRRGADLFDEMWDGVLHMVLPPRAAHQYGAARLFVVLEPITTALGLCSFFETGLFRAADDYRVPDQLYCRLESLSERGAEGAELVVEIPSPGDESYDKIDWYAARGVRELLMVHPPDRRVELLRAVGDRLLPVTADTDGAVRSDVLGVRFRTVGDRLELTWDGGSAQI